MSQDDTKQFLALDVGTKTCGVAGTDALGLTVQPLANLSFPGLHDMRSVFEELVTIMQNRRPKTIVVGLPLNMDGSKSPQVTKVEQFINAFKKVLIATDQVFTEINWIYFDERKTTEVADSFLIEMNVTRAKRKQVIDKMAAVFLLQSYLEEQGWDFTV